MKPGVGSGFPRERGNAVRQRGNTPSLPLDVQGGIKGGLDSAHTMSFRAERGISPLRGA